MRWLILGLLPLISCTHRVSKFYPQIVTSKPEVTMSLSGNGKQHMNIVYMGCGNIILEKNGEAVAFDPFFSNQGLLKLAGRIRSSPEGYRLWKNTYESFLARSAVKAALVSHTHYDHVMDLPLLLEDRYFLQMTNVYGSDYLPKMLQHFDDMGVNLNALTDDQVFDPRKGDDRYEWIAVTPRLRFLPILSNHAPHTKKKLYMDKPLDEEYFREHLVWSNSKVKAFRWTTGGTYSFLVDFIGADTLRVFVQTSASTPPFGFPPANELKKKKVDIAMLCYASISKIQGYPSKVVELTQPEKLIFVHWEDFFSKPRSYGKQRLVRMTNPKEARKIVDKLGRPAEFFVMPRPGTMMKVTY